MTLGIPRRPAPRTGLPAHTGPRTRISLGALTANLTLALSGSRSGLIDGRADAWGHGIVTLTHAALDAGADGVVVDAAGAQELQGVVPSSSWRLGAPGVHADDEASVVAYGLRPGLPPVMSLTGHVLSLKPLLAGEGVSYGFTHRASRDTVVALVTGGYAQGIVRGLGNEVQVWVAGARVPVVGRVAMDVCMIDVGEAVVSPGDDVVFFGGRSGDVSGPPSIHDWTRVTGLTAPELATAVGLRTRREVAA